MIFYSKKPAVCSSSTFIEAYHNEVLSKAKAHTFPYRKYSQEEINLFNSVNTIDACVFISEKGLSYQAGRLVVRNNPHVIVYPEGFYDTLDKVLALEPKNITVHTLSLKKAIDKL